MSCHFKAILCYVFPKIKILTGVMVGKWHVAYHSERHKRYVHNVAGLCYGAALHVYRRGIRKVIDDGLHLFARVNKPVARHGQSASHVRQPCLSRLVVKGQSLLYEVLRCDKGGRRSPPNRNKRRDRHRPKPPHSRPHAVWCRHLRHIR